MSSGSARDGDDANAIAADSSICMLYHVVVSSVNVAPSGKHNFKKIQAHSHTYCPSFETGFDLHNPTFIHGLDGKDHASQELCFALNEAHFRRPLLDLRTSKATTCYKHCVAQNSTVAEGDAVMMSDELKTASRRACT